MLNAKVEKAINDQINAELYSSYLYVAMSNHCSQINLPGAANWMRMQAVEELMHVTKFSDYIHDRQGTVVLGAIEAPPATWDSPIAVFEESYNHEVLVSGMINALVDTAMAASDHATVNFLQWFVSEQVEEESTVDDIVQKLKLVGQADGGIFMIDRELAGRALPQAPGATGA
jgi:ferritin